MLHVIFFSSIRKQAVISMLQARIGQPQKMSEFRSSECRCFAIGALLAGIGGILHSSRNFQTSVQMGIDLQLPAQICCLLGATYKTPGKYNVPGCVVGILLTAIITNGVYGTIGSSIYIKSLVEGLVFMTAIGIIATIRQEGLPKVKFDI